jgi:transposase
MARGNYSGPITAPPATWGDAARKVGNSDRRPPLEPDGHPTYSEVVADNTALRVQLDALAKRLAALESANLTLSADNVQLRARVGMNSRNSSKAPSSKAPSSDGYAKPAPKSRRVRSGKRPGKQPGVPGKFLPQVEDPDAVIEHKPDHCADCGEAPLRRPGDQGDRSAGL